VEGSEARLATFVEKHRTDGERFRVPERDHRARERDCEERDELRLWQLFEPRDEAEVDLTCVRDLEAGERTAITNRVAPARYELLTARPTLEVRRPNRMDVRKSTSDKCTSDLVAKGVRILRQLFVASRDRALERSRTFHDGFKDTTRTESIALVGHSPSYRAIGGGFNHVVDERLRTCRPAYVLAQIVDDRDPRATRSPRPRAGRRDRVGGECSLSELIDGFSTIASEGIRA
jgi:hypothetical protein